MGHGRQLSYHYHTLQYGVSIYLGSGRTFTVDSFSLLYDGTRFCTVSVAGTHIFMLCWCRIGRRLLRGVKTVHSVTVHSVKHTLFLWVKTVHYLRRCFSGVRGRRAFKVYLCLRFLYVLEISRLAFCATFVFGSVGKVALQEITKLACAVPFVVKVSMRRWNICSL